MVALGLGRHPAPDDRDRGYSFVGYPFAATDRRFRYWWAGGAWLNQGDTPTCVGHAWAHWLEDGPVTQPHIVAEPYGIYRDAQLVDEWVGEDYDGTSVRAGARVLRSRGLIQSFHWAWDVETLARALLELGPVVVGTNWYGSMFTPDAEGVVELEGRIVGGHAYLLNGVNLDAETFRAKNSWGRGWGRDGYCTISWANMQRLLDEDGEACRAVEVKQSPAPSTEGASS